MDYSSMTVARLKELCDEQGIEYRRDDRKADLVRYLEKYAEPIEVAAVPIEDGLAASSFAVDLTVVNDDITALTEAIDEALKVYGEAKADPDTLAEMSTGDISICEKQLADAAKAADDARLQLGRDYRKPLDMANARYKELMGPVTAMRDAFAEEREARRRGGLEATYVDFCTANGMESLPTLVPFQRILDAHPQWMRRDANAGKAAQKVEEVAQGIIDDWKALSMQRGSMRFYQEAEAEFFRTLDVSAAVKLNAQRTEDAEKIEAARAEREAADAWRAELTWTPAFEEVEPEPAKGPERPADGAVAPQRRRYRFEAWMTDYELASFREWKNSCGVGAGWTYREVQNG